MKIKDFKEVDEIKHWLDIINCEESTAESYLWGMMGFVEMVGKMPDELIREARQEIRDGLFPSERKILMYFVRYRKHLQDRGLANLTIRTRMTGVKSFYTTFGIETPNLRQHGKKGRLKPKSEHHVKPEKSDLQKVLKVCDPLEKALILTGVSSGLSVSDIIEIKYRDYINGYDPETKITTLKMTRAKTGVDFITFISPEANEAIHEYLAFRDDRHAISTYRKNQIAKQKIDPNGYLFIKRAIPDEYNVKKDENMRKLTTKGVQSIYRSVSTRAGLEAPKGTWNPIRSHNMRRYFNTELNLAGCNATIAEFLMGHALGDVKDAYLVPSPDKLATIYQKYCPYLTIDESVSVTDAPEYKQLESENEILLNKLKQSEINKIQFDALCNEIEQLKQQEAARQANRMEFNKIIELMNSLDDDEPMLNMEELKQHEHMMKIDPTYRERFKNATSISKQMKLEKQKAEIVEKLWKMLSESGPLPAR